MGDFGKKNIYFDDVASRMSMMSVTTKVEDESDQMNYTDQLENNIKNL